MKFQPDVVRDILLYVEEHSGPFGAIKMDDIVNDVANECGYDGHSVYYHIRQCDLNGLFYGVIFTTDDPELKYGSKALITDLSPKGHEFIGNVRDSSNWKKVKNVSKRAGAASIGFLFDVSKALLKQTLEKILFNG